MRKTNRWTKAVLTALLGAIVMAGCGGGAEETPEAGGGHKEGDGHDHKEGEKH